MPEAIAYIPEGRGVTRVALTRDAEELSIALIVPMTIQLGRAQVRMDGIGGVATPERYRHRGYSRRVLEAAVDTMMAGDAVLSTLYGIPRFYPKYGYATLGPEYTIAPVSLDERAALPEDCTTRNGRPGDLGAIQRLYRDETAGGYGPARRDDDWWVWDELATALGPGAGEVRVVERHGMVVGYAWRASTCWWMETLDRDGSSPALRIGEAFAEDMSAAEAVLAMCRRWAVEQGQPRLELAISPSSRVGAAARFQNVTITERYGDESEFMGRSVGLLALLRALIPELEPRWRAMSAGTPPFAMTIHVDHERVTLAGDENGIEVGTNRPGDVEIRLDPGTMARLVFGGFEPDVALARTPIPAATRQIVAGLFPRHVPYMYPADRF